MVKFIWKRERFEKNELEGELDSEAINSKELDSEAEGKNSKREEAEANSEAWPH